MFKKTISLLLLITLTAAVTSCSKCGKGSLIKRKSSLIELSGDNYYPDSIAAKKDGTLFVSSMWTGQIDKIPAEVNSPVSFIPPEKEKRTALGLLVDENKNRLWACFWDYHQFMKIPAQLKSFDLKTGDFVKAYDFPKGAIGNDLAMDKNGNIYTTCSFTHKIYRLPEGGNALEVWSDNSLFAKDWKEGWTLNGIVWDGKSSIYVNRTDNDGLYRVSIKKDGSAGSVQKIDVEDKLKNFGQDGMAILDKDTLLIAENMTGRLILTDIKGDKGQKKVVSAKLNFPTNAVVVGDNIWVVESQIDHMLGYDKTPPQPPFLLKRVNLPSY